MKVSLQLATGTLSEGCWPFWYLKSEGLPSTASVFSSASGMLVSASKVLKAVGAVLPPLISQSV